MADIPFIILAFVFGVSSIILALAYIYRTSFPMSTFWFLVGAMLLIVFITTDNISLEYFSSGLTDNLYSYNVESRTGAVSLTAINTAMAEYASTGSSLLVGDTINCIDLYIGKSGTPTGTAEIGTMDGSASGNIILSFGTQDVSALTSASIWYTYCLTGDSTYTIQINDRIGIRYTGGNASNTLNTSVDGNNPFDSTITFRQVLVSGVWTSSTSQDLTARFYLSGGDFEITPNNYPIRDSVTLEPTYIGVVFIILSLSFIMIGILIERYA